MVLQPSIDEFLAPHAAGTTHDLTEPSVQDTEDVVSRAISTEELVIDDIMESLRNRV